MELHVPLGSEIVLPGGERAILKFVGNVESKSGIFAGVELIGQMSGKGKNSGEFKNVQYFTTKVPNSGIFLPYQRLLETSNMQRLQAETPTKTKRNVYVSRSPLAVSNQQGLKRSSKESSPSTVAGNEGQLHSLKTENTHLSQKCLKLETQLQECTEVLESMEKVIKDHYEPAFNQMEKDLSEKNEKISKLKVSFDEQKTELLDIIDSLEKQASETEQLYTKELKRLREECAAYKNKDTAKETNELQRQLKVKEKMCQDWELKYTQLKDSKSKEENDIIQGYQREIDDLKAKLSSSQKAQPEKNTEIEEQLQRLKAENRSLQQQLETAREKEKIQPLTSTTTEQSTLLDENGNLQIFVPKNSDPANGRKKWCGLCEREGHDSVQCPFENDMF
ncbi:Interface between microtubules and kinetochore protein [Komagataella phaffii CBS 7435]|uniref:Nuclear fusion protein BIK1 n=2 Tax=Komagataella phaffii TaxID=460519 RepID=C4QXL8_KOMPG|nr:Nuclear fusion protein BIK1 [Komagataella phaffii GS115]AOA61857.1 GQ67_02024T0 [Komagataella phaffii]CAH2446805.1 Interface between microtubules and kinetochore protein [Komagataella phaffii CBS 7435]AOA66290.1 GQ68_02039T0 [Komagataella phaffii GS115]CAY67991.1 Nuclear fusion protein BIK1 [Komagataella phaffii GS115]CCA37065.1 Interface between microtubules and kinetochore protein [Komagataella phaffii CBS 7435]